LECLRLNLAHYCTLHHIEREAHCNLLQHFATRFNSFKLTATHCNPLQLPAQDYIPLSGKHAATRCNTLQHAVSRCKSLQHAATYCNTLHLTEREAHCNTQQQFYTCAHTFTPRHTRSILPLCNTLQRTATHCNTRQHTKRLCSTKK